MSKEGRFGTGAFDDDGGNSGPVHRDMAYRARVTRSSVLAPAV